MDVFTFSPKQRNLLAICAILGLVGPNGLFIVAASKDSSLISRTLHDPLALAFVSEAFLLMGLLAWLIKASGQKKPGWLAFTIMSLLGSLAFSVPAYLWLMSRDRARSS